MFLSNFLRLGGGLGHTQPPIHLTSFTRPNSLWLVLPQVIRLPNQRSLLVTVNLLIPL